MPLIALKKYDQSRTSISQTSLEEEIIKAAKADDACAALMGVIVERLIGQNWPRLIADSSPGSGDGHARSFRSGQLCTLRRDPKSSMAKMRLPALDRWKP